MQRIASILRLEGLAFDDATLGRLEFATTVNRNAGLVIIANETDQMLLFASPKSAVICAIELRRLDETTSIDQGLSAQLRGAVSLGPVTIQEDQVTGDALEIADNMATNLTAGDIFVSRSCRETLGEKLPVDYSRLRADAAAGYRVIVDANEVLSAIRHKNPVPPDWSWKITAPLIGIAIIVVAAWIWFNIPDVPASS